MKSVKPDLKKNKKALRKQTNEYLCALEKFCRDAQAVEDMLHNLTPFSKYEKNGLQLSLSYYKSDSFSASRKDELFLIFEHNMRHLYEQSAVGWIKKEKWDELFDTDARYILATDESDTIHGW